MQKPTPREVVIKKICSDILQITVSTEDARDTLHKEAEEFGSICQTYQNRKDTYTLFVNASYDPEKVYQYLKHIL